MINNSAVREDNKWYDIESLLRKEFIEDYKLITFANLVMAPYLCWNFLTVNF